MAQTVITGNSSSAIVQGSLTVQTTLQFIGNNYDGSVNPLNLNGASNPYSPFSTVPFATTGSVQTFAVPAGSGGYMVQPNANTTGNLSINTIGANVSNPVNPIAPYGPHWFDVAGGQVPASVFILGGNVTRSNLLLWL